MDTEKESKDDVSIIRLKDERLDSNIAPELKAELLILVDQGAKKIIVDLKNVTYADSSGLGALLFGLRQSRDNGGSLLIVGANSRITNLIRIAKLEEILINYENEIDALANF